jgi:hypothetical protein
MIKRSTGLLSMQKPGADERSPTQMGKDTDSVLESQIFFSGDSSRDTSNDNAKPKANNSYQGSLSYDDNDVGSFFDFLINGKNFGDDREENTEELERKISFRHNISAIKKISKRA